ncbi:conserved hypothetical protein [Bathymodiolus platifrons methanotrophic gill symbiont]|uniref:retron St85 family effector protein n=1 Tax=Bathymodiolus platifrons methanotrophic gill symbiont TaxID=113268 RepID=UPI000B412C5E|nr:retron St85 family effector protein [Bathymodiolus platifrons methanotrophic gill symbiont]GAW87875.1 conserved hypothetical protein [Bathymodiolus platifrons methanotrophic gill symbiont]GFO77803.1 hypothetical protein BPLS_P6475 [Bathymodiolus platifrons methanotrophic gill symbiont]
MEINDPRESLLSLISIENSHVNLRPPKILLFGGDMSDQENKTVRALLYDHLSVKHSQLFSSLVLVEEFKDWLHDSIYPDLLTFESDLAETASLVVISLESPGALAELGSFSVNEKIKEKIVIIICDDHHNQDSYIKLGPLRQLKDENILSYPYKYNDLENSLKEHLDDITDSLSNILDEVNKTEKFNLTNKGHIAFLIYDLILTYKALINKEIKLYLKSLNVDVAPEEVSRLLFLLEKLELIEKRRMGNREYYLVIDNNHRIVFSNKKNDDKFDRNSAIIAAAQYYKSSKKEKIRMKVLEFELGTR